MSSEFIKISLNISNKLNEDVREFAKNNNLTLSQACELLMNQALDPELKSRVPKEEFEKLLEKNKELENNIRLEKESRLKDYQDVILKNTEISSQLLDLMKADRVLQLESKEVKESLFHRVKVFFLGNDKQS